MITQFPEIPTENGLHPTIEDMAVLSADGRFCLVQTDGNGTVLYPIGSPTDDWRTIELLIAVFRA